MTLIASHHATKEQEQLMLDIFNEMGLAMLIPEKQMAATTALTSCGIAALNIISATNTIITFCIKLLFISFILILLYTLFNL